MPTISTKVAFWFNIAMVVFGVIVAGGAKLFPDYVPAAWAAGIVQTSALLLAILSAINVYFHKFDPNGNLPNAVKAIAFAVLIAGLAALGGPAFADDKPIRIAKIGCGAGGNFPCTPSGAAADAPSSQANILNALGGPFQDLADFINSDFAGAAALSTAIPTLQDGNGKACWTAMSSFGAIIKAHPVPATLKIATDLEALRLTVMATNQLCASAACTQVFNEAGNAVATMGIGVPIPKLSDLCAKIPQVAVVPPTATPVASTPAAATPSPAP